jgi:putative amide transporter protein
MAVGFGLTNIMRFDDVPTGLLWLRWAVLWGLFWAVLALKLERLTEVTGWLTLILSVTTCTVPGFLLLLGEWGHVPAWAVLTSIVATVAVLTPVAGPSRTPNPTPASSESLPVPVG